MVISTIIKDKSYQPLVKYNLTMIVRDTNILVVLSLSRTLYEGAAYMSKRVPKQFNISKTTKMNKNKFKNNK